jgi:hypothetical protein
MKSQEASRVIEDELQKHMNTIKLEAEKCYRMLRKPSPYEVADLINEGVIIFFIAYEKYPTKERMMSLTKYFHRSLINGLNCILINSYRAPSTNSVTIERRMINCSSPDAVCNLLTKIEGLSNAAMQYLLFSLNIPREAQTAIVKNPRSKFQQARKHLGISWKEDRAARVELAEVFRG